MTILVIADEELVGARLPQSNADILISCGDLPDDVILHAAQKCSCQQIVAVKGNHDSSAGFPSQIYDLHLRTLEFHGLIFGGFCGCWKYKPRGNYLFEQSEVEAALAPFPKVDLFVAHNSPRMVHDRDDEVHVGFTAFTNYITRAQPRFFLHGHQHIHQESSIGRTQIISTYGYRFMVIS